MFSKQIKLDGEVMGIFFIYQITWPALEIMLNSDCIYDQHRLRQACTNVQSCQSLCCSAGTHKVVKQMKALAKYLICSQRISMYAGFKNDKKTYGISITCS